MREGEDIVRACLAAELLRQAADDTVHAADSRDNPYLVADTHLPVFAAIAHESTVLIGNVEHYFLGVVFIGE